MYRYREVARVHNITPRDAFFFLYLFSLPPSETALLRVTYKIG